MRPPNFTTFLYFVWLPFFVHFSKKFRYHGQAPQFLSTGLASNSKLFISESTVTCIEPVDKSNQNEKKCFCIFAIDRDMLDCTSFLASKYCFLLFLPSRWPQCKWPQQQKTTTTSSKTGNSLEYLRFEVQFPGSAIQFSEFKIRNLIKFQKSLQKNSQQSRFFFNYSTHQKFNF